MNGTTGESIDSVSPRAPADRSADVSTLTRFLRTTGAVLLVASASTFLLQRWQSGNDVLRYAFLVGHTALLAAAAFVCGIRVRESRGARTFFGLVLAVLPINFAVLGGLLYSQFALDDPGAVLPRYAVWIAPDPLTAAIAALVTLIVLGPLCFMAHLALARSSAARLTAVSLSMNALLAIPVRDPDVIGVLFAIGAVLLTRLELRVWPKDAALVTLEGAIARCLSIAPLGLLVGRAIYLYEPTALLSGAFGLTAGYALFAGAPRFSRSRLIAGFLQATGAALSGVGWCAVAHALWPLLPSSLALSVLALPYSGLLVIMSIRANSGSSIYRRCAAAIAFGAVMLNVTFESDMAASALGLFVGIGLAAYGILARKRTELVLGGLAAVVALLDHLAAAIHLEALFSWSALSLLGVIVIFVAAFVERRQEQLGAFLESWKS